MIGLHGCNTLVFKQPMPVSGIAVEALPPCLEGTFVSVHFDSNQLMAKFHRVTRFSDKHCLVYEQNVIYLDSLTNSDNKIGDIQEVSVEDNELLVIGNKSNQTIKFMDSLKSELEEKKFEIDLKNGYFITDFPNMDTAKCVLKNKNNGYYLNAVYDDLDYWQVMRLEERENYLTIVTTSSLEDSMLNHLSNFEEKYQLEQIQRNTFSKVFLADVDDVEFEQLLSDRQLLSDYKWYKIKSVVQPQQTNGNRWLYVLGFVIFIVIGWAVWKFKVTSE